MRPSDHLREACRADWVAVVEHPFCRDLPFFFGEWITLHSGEGFEGVVAHLRTQLDQAWERLEEPGRAQVAADFARAVALERAFFDAAYCKG